MSIFQTPEELGRCETEFYELDSYHKAMRFGGDELKEKLKELKAEAEERKNQRTLEAKRAEIAELRLRAVAVLIGLGMSAILIIFLECC